MGNNVLGTRAAVAVLPDKMVMATGRGIIDDSVELPSFLKKAVQSLELGNIKTVTIELLPDKTIVGAVKGTSKDVTFNASSGQQ